MAEQFIGPVVAGLLAALQELVPAQLGDLEGFRSYGRLYTGVAVATPALWIQPARTSFDAEAGYTSEVHDITVKLAVTGPSPDELAVMAMGYVAAVHRAIGGMTPGDWGDLAGSVLRVFVLEHDYGPLFQRDGGFGRFPELHVIVQTAEVAG